MPDYLCKPTGEEILSGLYELNNIVAACLRLAEGLGTSSYDDPSNPDLWLAIGRYKDDLQKLAAYADCSVSSQMAQWPR